MAKEAGTLLQLGACVWGTVTLVSPCSRYQPGDAASSAAVARAGGGGRTTLTLTCAPSMGASPVFIAFFLTWIT